MNTYEYVTESEREQICDRICDDLICSRHCAVYRKALERQETAEKTERRADNDRP